MVSRCGLSPIVRALAASSISLCVTATSPAEALIVSTGDEFVIVSQHETAQALLEELHGKFGVRYQSPVPLDHFVDGERKGLLSSVIQFVLNGYDYVIEYDSGGALIRVVGKSGLIVRAGSTWRIASHTPPTSQPTVRSLLEDRVNSQSREPATATSVMQANVSPATIAELTTRAQAAVKNLRSALERVAR